MLDYYKQMEKYILFVVIFIHVIYFIINSLNKSMIFYPEKINKTVYNTFLDKYKHNYISCDIHYEQNNIISCGIYNYYRKPSFNDMIFLYSHGNKGWIGTITECNVVKLLSKFGSVMLYDYSGYGYSSGSPSDVNMQNNVLRVWSFLVNNKKINIKKIIVVGFSLGCCASTHLISRLTNENAKIPKNIILVAPFSNLYQMALNFTPLLQHLITQDFNNYKNIMNIKNNVNIHIFHSIHDELIHFNHSKILSNNTNKFVNSKLIKISGLHSSPGFDENIIKNIENNIINNNN